METDNKNSNQRMPSSGARSRPEEKEAYGVEMWLNWGGNSYKEKKELLCWLFPPFQTGLPHFQNKTNKTIPAPDASQQASGIRWTDQTQHDFLLQPLNTFGDHTSLLCIIGREFVQFWDDVSTLFQIMLNIYSHQKPRDGGVGSTSFLFLINYNIECSLWNCVFNQFCNKSESQT